MRIADTRALGPYNERSDHYPVGILRDKLICDPCKGPMMWIGETEQYRCPTCENRKTLVKRVTKEEQDEQLSGLGSPGGGEFVASRDPAMFVVAGIQTIMGVGMILSAKAKFSKEPWKLALTIGGAYLLANGAAELVISGYLRSSKGQEK